MTPAPPRLTWANNPATHETRDRLQAVVDRVHARHPLSHAGADVSKEGWLLSMRSLATGRITTMPASGYVLRDDGRSGSILPSPYMYGRDPVRELCDALDETARFVTHPKRPAFKARLVDMAVLRATTDHDAFTRIVDAPVPTPVILWNEQRWESVDVPHAETIRTESGVSLEYERGDGWKIRRHAPDWEFDGQRIHLIDASLPESTLAVCARRAFDDVFDVPTLRGAGLIIHAVVASRRARKPSLRVSVALRRMSHLDEALEMSRRMHA